VPAPLEITTDVTRDDWLAANQTLLQEGPYWQEAARRYQRTVFWQSLWMVPVFSATFAWMLWHATTPRVAVGLTCASAVLVVLGLSRVDVVARTKAKALDQLRRVDLSAYVGRISVSMDESGVRTREPSRELKLAWTAVTPHDVGDYLMFAHGGSDATIIPKHAFPSPEAAAAFYQQAVAWWRAGQLPPAERLARYLADRDVACPRCTYNLRGLRAQSCPECGEALTVERLIGAKQ
jgi:hypothetical protein